MADRDGKNGGLMTLPTSTENSDRKQRLELDPQETRQLSDSIIDMAHVIIIVLDHAGRIVRFNRTAEHVTGYTAKEVLGQNMWDVIVPRKEKFRIIQGIRNLRQSGLPIQTEELLLTRDKRERLALWSARGILDKHGKTKWIVCTGVDITEQKALEDQIQKSDKMRAMGELAVEIAHDFNNILTGIKGHIRLLEMKLEKGIGNENDVRASLEKVAGATQRASELVGQILRFVKGMPSRQEDINIDDLAEEVIQILQPSLKKENIRVEMHKNGQAPIITGDAGKLQQVILNLIVNAIHACSDSGRGSIIIRTGTRPCLKGRYGMCAFLEVEDTGSGMEANVKNKIFEPYFSTKDKTREGTGLGLFVVYNIVRSHGGKIKVWSRPGKGSRFSLYFPLAEKEYESPAEIKPVPDEAARPLTIMAVDGREDLRELLAEGLEMLGYRSFTAGTGKKALALYERHRKDIDLVIIDRFLPDMDCRDILQRMKDLEPGINAIIMAGYVPNEEEIKSMPGVIDILYKPFSFFALKSLLAIHAEKKET